MKERQPVVYIVTNRKNGVLYTGVTSDLVKRIYEHKNKITKGFTSKYNCDKLVLFELYETMEAAIKREKQIKGWLREKKIKLIEDSNPEWTDLYEQVV